MGSLDASDVQVNKVEKTFVTKIFPDILDQIYDAEILDVIGTIAFVQVSSIYCSLVIRDIKITNSKLVDDTT